MSSVTLMPPQLASQKSGGNQTPARLFEVVNARIRFDVGMLYIPTKQSSSALRSASDCAYWACVAGGTCENLVSMNLISGFWVKALALAVESASLYAMSVLTYWNFTSADWSFGVRTAMRLVI